MCKKSKFPLVFNIFLAFFITLVVTIFVKAGEGALTPESFIIGMIQGFCLNMTLETIIDLPPWATSSSAPWASRRWKAPPPTSCACWPSCS